MAPGLAICIVALPDIVRPEMPHISACGMNLADTQQVLEMGAVFEYTGSVAAAWMDTREWRNWYTLAEAPHGI